MKIRNGPLLLPSYILRYYGNNHYALCFKRFVGYMSLYFLEFTFHSFGQLESKSHQFVLWCLHGKSNLPPSVNKDVWQGHN